MPIKKRKKFNILDSTVQETCSTAVRLLQKMDPDLRVSIVVRKGSDCNIVTSETDYSLLSKMLRKLADHRDELGPVDANPRGSP